MIFEVGACVQLKSGGPRMQVDAIDGGRVHCFWYGEADDTPRREAFREIDLKPCEQDRSSDQSLPDYDPFDN